MYVCMYAYAYIIICVDVYMDACMYAFSTFLCLCVYMHIRMELCMRAQLLIGIDVYVYVSNYIRVYICIRVRMAF